MKRLVNFVRRTPSEEERREKLLKEVEHERKCKEKFYKKNIEIIKHQIKDNSKILEIPVSFKNHKYAMYLEETLKNKGYKCQYIWSYITKFHGVLEIKGELKEVLERHSSFTIKNKKDCIICFDPIDVEFTRFKCGHLIHPNCHKKLNECPICIVSKIFKNF